jgi:hypothetical protein
MQQYRRRAALAAGLRESMSLARFVVVGPLTGRSYHVLPTLFEGRDFPFWRYTLVMVPVEVAIERLRNPKPGGKIWAAREYGVDLTQLIARLQQTPDERLRYADRMIEDLKEWRRAASNPS